MNILVTGVAGFIGADLAHKLLTNGHTVIGIDNLNDYYDVSLKQDRLKLLSMHTSAKDFVFIEASIDDRQAMSELFADHKFDAVVNLAAQAGVRYSIDNPQSYIDSNLLGFANILEGCRQTDVAHLVYASSSSVYGANKNFPFSEQDTVDNPISLYAATKKSNELMAHSYSHLYDFRCTGLRFFTVYGPWGRPDMAPFRFASRMLKGEPIPVYNQGKMIRDFTYIDDITEGVVRITESQTTNNQDSSAHSLSNETVAKHSANYNIYNIGRGESVELLHFIDVLAAELGVEAKLDMLPMQDGDVPRTMADTTALQNDFNYRPKISIEQGVKQFAQWYKGYY